MFFSQILSRPPFKWWAKKFEKIIKKALNIEGFFIKETLIIISPEWYDAQLISSTLLF